MSPGSDGASHLVLVGLMGTGKTTVGTRVAERLGRPFVDSDEQIEARTGRTVREIFESDGEDAFRRLETEALYAALACAEPSVIAGAGGVVLRPENRDALQPATVVWLRADPELLVERVDTGSHRPLLRDDPLGVLRQMARDRSGLYDEVSDAVVDIDRLSVDEVVERVLAVAR